MISVHFGDTPIGITVIQVYAKTTDAEEDKVGQFYEYLQHLLELTHTHTHTQMSFHCRRLECKNRKSRDTWNNRQVWPWSTK